MLRKIHARPCQRTSDCNFLVQFSKPTAAIRIPLFPIFNVASMSTSGSSEGEESGLGLDRFAGAPLRRLAVGA